LASSISSNSGGSMINQHYSFSESGLIADCFQGH